MCNTRVAVLHMHILVGDRAFCVAAAKPGTVFRQKWRHQWHCQHLNKNLKLTFFSLSFPGMYLPILMYSDCNAFAFVHLKLWLIHWLIDDEAVCMTCYNSLTVNHILIEFPQFLLTYLLNYSELKTGSSNDKQKQKQKIALKHSDTHRSDLC